jgi:lipopolysaccharide export system protein LptA
MIRKRKTLIFLFFFIAAYVRVLGQADTTEPIQILPPTGNLEVRTQGGNTIQILSGGVKLKQGNTLFTCDSCIINSAANMFEAFGHVYINDSDTAKVWSDYLRYLTDKKLAYLTGKVRLTDGHGTLTTNNLEYDVARKIGTYTNGGRVVNKKTVLTSREGIYYTDIKDIYFKNNVFLKDPAYTLSADSLLYNTETQVARFITSTTIRDSSGRVIKTKEGYYDLKEGKAEFTQRTSVQDKSLFMIGDQIASDDKSGIIQVQGRGVLVDTAKGINLLANQIFINKKTDALLATQKPVMTIKQGNDSFFIAADTIFSARLTDLYKDSLKTAKWKGDSTDRYVEAYRSVRVFSDSMQSASDSMFYSFRDSIFRLYQKPVVWSNKSQITGDTILLYTKNKKADRIKVYDNSFMVTEVQTGIYNQVQSARMDGYFIEGSIDSVRARGLAESIYFMQDKDSAFTGVNQTTSDAIDIYFRKGDLYKVVLRSAVKGDLFPIKFKEPSAMRLTNFIWLEERRPKSKYDLFE